MTDNDSTDQTRQIMEKYPEVVELIDEPGDNHDQPTWVTRMARMACKLNPDWIVHLDADELWCGLTQLRTVYGKIAGCDRMYLHPPIDEQFDLIKQRHYLNFDNIKIPQECKVAHRPDPEISITHGNHGVVNDTGIQFTGVVYRHHYPVRSYEQWARKATGNESLKRRKVYCERWQNWYNLLTTGKLREEYSRLTSVWQELVKEISHEKFLSLVGFWATPDMQEFFGKYPEMLPKIEQWPRGEHA